jgi:hypothetical protein
MASRIWSSPRNPPRSVANRLGIARAELRRRLHRIKRAAKLGPRDRVTIWDDGSVTDEADDNIGNLQEET